MVQQEYLGSENEYSPPPEPGRTHVTISNIIVNGGGRAIQGSRQKPDVILMIEPIVMTGREKRERRERRDRPFRRFAKQKKKRQEIKAEIRMMIPFCVTANRPPHSRIDILISRIHPRISLCAANEPDSQYILRIHARESSHYVLDFVTYIVRAKLNVIIKLDVKFD